MVHLKVRATGPDGDFIELDPAGKTRGLAAYKDVIFVCREDKNDIHVYKNTVRAGCLELKK